MPPFTKEQQIRVNEELVTVLEQALENLPQISNLISRDEHSLVADRYCDTAKLLEDVAFSMRTAARWAGAGELITRKASRHAIKMACTLHTVEEVHRQ